MKLIDHFQTISFLNVERKIFFADLAKRFTSTLESRSEEFPDSQIVWNIYKCNLSSDQRDKGKKERSHGGIARPSQRLRGSIFYQLIYTVLRYYHVDSQVQKIITGLIY